MSDPLDGATVLARWKFVFDEPDERGGGFVMGEFLLRDDGALLRRMGGSSTGSDGSGGYDRSWRFGPWSTVPSWTTIGPYCARGRDSCADPPTRGRAHRRGVVRHPCRHGQQCRQSGNSTLTRLSAAQAPRTVIRLLDDPATMRATIDDPTGFVEHNWLTAIDEIQLAPDLLRPIKVVVDLDPRPGRA